MSQVSAAHGIQLEGNITIPKGVRIGVPMYEIHHDKDSYDNPSIFNPFRFYRHLGIAEMTSEATAGDGGIAQTSAKARLAEDSGNAAVGDPTSETKPLAVSDQRQTSVVTGGDTFLGFGYGRHACPGRFFAAHEMKLLLAHLVQHYDVEHMAERPMQQTILETKLPPSSLRIRVRRRKDV